MFTRAMTITGKRTILYLIIRRLTFKDTPHFKIIQSLSTFSMGSDMPM